MTMPYGYTTTGQQLANFQKTLNAITGVPSSPMQDAQTQASSAYYNLAGNQAKYQQDIQNQNTNQAGVPALVSQYDNIQQLYDLYLHDSNLAQKYAAGGGSGNVNPHADPNLLASANANQANLQAGNQADIARVSNMTTPEQPGATVAVPGAQSTAVSNPYLGSSDAIIASTANAPQAPGLTTAEMKQPLNAGAILSNLLTQLIGAEQGVAKDATITDMAAYTDKMSTLKAVADMISGAISTQSIRNANASSIPGTKQNAGAVFNDIITQLHQQKGNAVTEYDIWSYLNEHQGALEAQGVDMNTLWKLHKDLATKVGTGGTISGGKATTEQQKQASSEKAGIEALRGFGNLMDTYWKGSTDIAGVRVVNPLSGSGGQFEAMKKVYTGKLQQALKVGRGKYNFETLMASIPGEISVGGRAIGNLQGHLSELLTNNGLTLYQDKKTGRVGVVGEAEFNPDTDIRVDATNVPINKLIQVLKSL